MGSRFAAVGLSAVELVATSQAGTYGSMKKVPAALRSASIDCFHSLDHFHFLNPVCSLRPKQQRAGKKSRHNS